MTKGKAGPSASTCSAKRVRTYSGRVGHVVGPQSAASEALPKEMAVEVLSKKFVMS